jgi:transposase
MFASQIQAEAQLPVKKRRVQQLLQDDPNFKWEKRASKPKLTPLHKENRLKFAKKAMAWDVTWAHTLFSDEKKWNLDGPDGQQMYWHDLRKDKQIKWSRNFGGGSVMCWLSFCSKGKPKVVFTSSKMKSKDYIEVIKDKILIDGRRFLGDDLIFQQDNASIHKSKETMLWFEANNVNIMDWPSLSPDLNPVEHVWSWLVRRVYENGKQYGCVNELKHAIEEAWEECPQEYLNKLINSMPDRIFEVIRLNGGKTHY